MTWKIRFTPAAKGMLDSISDRRIRAKIGQKIEGLANEPQKQGKPLTGELGGHRSLRVVGQRYRIIYRIVNDLVVVLVIAVGLRKDGDRKDIYALAHRLVRLGLTG